MHCAPDSASFRKGVTFWASLINNLVAFVGAFISVFEDKHCANSAQSAPRACAWDMCECRAIRRIVCPTWRVTCDHIHAGLLSLSCRYASTTPRQLCACAPWLRCFDTARFYLRASFPNANCLRISNEPLKYRIQWLRPPEAKAAGTRARNATVNESPPGWGRGVG